jgi:phage terminase Nu1 subunit (DNA packaging protein)
MATQIEVATHLDLSDRQVRNLLADGVLPGSKGRGGFDLEACRLAYIRYLRGLGNSQVKPETGSESDEMDPLVEYKLMEERRGLTAAQRIGQELKNEVAKKRLIPAEFITFAFAKFIPAAGSIFDTVVMTLRRRHPELTPGQLDSISRELTKARNTIAQAADRLPEWHDEFIDLPD